MIRRAVFCLLLGFTAAPIGTARAAIYYPSHFTLSNGLQVVVVPNRLAPVVNQMVWYKVGSADEVRGKTGLAHYLEHLMFRGTDNIAAGEFSRIIAGQGGNDNAFTSRDYTAYYETVEASRLPMIMQMEADRMANLRLTKETADPELKVILDERQQRTDNSPDGRFVEKFETRLAPGHPYGRPVIGWKKDLEKLTAADARKFYEAYYAPNNAVVVISGNVKVEEVMSLAAATYGRLSKKETPPQKKIPPRPLPSQTSDFTLRDARVEQPQVLWRFVAPAYVTQRANEAYAFEVLSEVLDSGEVGIMHKKLVQEMGIASSIRTSYDPDARGETTFTISASLRDGKSPVALKKALREVLRSLSENGLSSERVEDAKQRLQRDAIFAREGITMPGYSFGMALSTGRSVSDVEAWPDRINEVTPEQVNAALKEMAESKRQLMGALLPSPKVPRVSKSAKNRAGK